jgi:hypothetical protein
MATRDNFRSHLKRVHGKEMRTDEDFDYMIARCVNGA